MTHTARRIGRSLALVLPVVLVLSGTLAVSAVPWAGQDSTTQLTASSTDVSVRAKSRAPQDILRDQLLAELQQKDPGTALTHLQREVENRPSLADHCMSIARALGRAAVKHYGPSRAQSFSRPVCDTAYATGVMRAS
ncbi:putative small membrane protein [Streptomyces venezuelae]|uniref:Uncharacterized protein n=1 Tax=Streptomyces narbonensis TaxID=67333 RepID=A0ABV3CE97_9ACTN|nr:MULTISPECIES: hypothetical protein [Streptomyces]ALO09983.1 putative small membrane protein [Streptomyces venezuelae]QPK47023.1 hypothetical protein H4W23_22015 [Streptomyces gardneri]WRK38439.1 hypothetical protein U0M97_22115 [Streptomyces venezuelae]CUM39572.1 putative small membrane protein [Streptomyces venezuelae]GGV98014.1 membrane protein [Streptomyces narbonensis]